MELKQKLDNSPHWKKASCDKFDKATNVIAKYINDFGDKYLFFSNGKVKVECSK